MREIDETAERVKFEAVTLSKYRDPFDAVYKYGFACWLAAKRAALSDAKPVAVPDGWQLVPIKPTDEMEEECPYGQSYALNTENYNAMLAAAPVPPAAQLFADTDHFAMLDENLVKVHIVTLGGFDLEQIPRTLLYAAPPAAEAKHE